MDIQRYLFDLLNGHDVTSAMDLIPAVKALKEMDELKHVTLGKISMVHGGAAMFDYQAIATEESYRDPKVCLAQIGRVSQQKDNVWYPRQHNECKKYEIQVEERPAFWISMTIYNPKFDPVAAGWIAK